MTLLDHEPVDDMSQLLNLTNDANQRLTATRDRQRYDLTLKATNGVMSVTVIRDGITIFTNLRVVAGVPFIPYQYLETGNFLIETQNQCLPDFTQFGNTQFLLYFSPAEVVAFRGG